MIFADNNLAKITKKPNRFRFIDDLQPYRRWSLIWYKKGERHQIDTGNRYCDTLAKAKSFFLGCLDNPKRLPSGHIIRPPSRPYAKLPSNLFDRLYLWETKRDWEDIDGKMYYLFQRTKHASKCIGEFEIYEDETIHSRIYDIRMRGIGLGYLSYVSILERRGKLITSYHNASEEAQSIWHKLTAKFPYNVDFFIPRLTVTWSPIDCKTIPFLCD